MSSSAIHRFIVIVIFTTVIISCNEQNLGDGYYYLSKHEAIDIGYPYGSIIYKSDNKNSFSDVKIFADISKAEHNNRYIIVLQKPNKEAMASLLKADIVFWSKFYLRNAKDSMITICGKKMFLKNIYDLSEEKDMEILSRKIYEIIDAPLFYGQIFKRKENYYIIDKKKDSILGPLGYEEFKILIAKKKINLKFW